VDPAATQYVDRDGAALAYQVVGGGPPDLVVHLEIVQHLDLCWTDPHVHHNFERVAALGRAVLFQRRGFGLSDPVSYVPTLEQQADDVLAVMDAAGMDRAYLYGVYSSALPVAMAAACAPERVAALVLHAPFADGLPAGDHLPDGWNTEDAAAFRHERDLAFGEWGSGRSAPLYTPAWDTPYNRRLMGMLERSSATPAAAQAHGDWYSRLDISDVLRAISVPTYVVRQETDRIPESVTRAVAGLIPGATYHSLPGIPVGASLGEGYTSVIDFIEQVILGDNRATHGTRSLATVLFTDIVGSTELLARLGDSRYHEIRDAHERQVHLAVENAGGRLVKVLGDGTLSVFDGPGRAVRCADVIRREAATLGLEIRAGVHTGEMDRVGPDVAGLTVHIGARVSAAAGPGEILVSRTVRDIVAGSGLLFTDRGEQVLKGVPGSWRLFALSSVDAQSGTVDVEPSMQTLADRTAVLAARRVPGTMRTLMRLGNSIQRRRVRRGFAEASSAHG
jgi:class 3 adenylate cyclase